MDSSASLQRWQQAFEDHPISTTRILEKQLRAGVANNRERLRGLVGGNYRELLSTADQIVSLDKKTRAAEVKISALGQLCGPPPRPVPRTDDALTRTAATLFLQQRCIDATKSSIVKSDLLRAAQLLVIARLLSKSLNDEQHTPASVPTLQERATALRRHVLLRIDNVLTNPRSSSKAIVQAASAYCLVNSASSGDAFKYAQRLRLEKLRKVLDSEPSPSDLAVGMLRYILATCQVLKRVFARALTDALTSIQRRPILQDLNLVSTGVVGSSEFLTLIPDDIRAFSPYFKREPVSVSELAASLGQWTSEACDILKTALQQQLQQTDKISKVLGLRRQLYETLLPLYFIPTSSEKIHLIMEQELLQRVETLVKGHSNQLAEIAAKLASSHADGQNLDLWKPEVATMQVSDGGSTFLRQVKKRRHGTTNEVLTGSRSLSKWTSSVRQMQKAFEQTKSIRWRDILEEPDDDQDEEADGILQALINDAPTSYTLFAESRLKAAIAEFETQILAEANKCTTQADGYDVRVAVHYVRVIRLALQPLRGILPQESVLEELEGAIPRLHQHIAEQATARILSALGDKGLASLRSTALVEHIPSPAAFTLLQEVCTATSSIGGSDIWSRTAVGRLKSCLSERILAKDTPFAWGDFDRAYLSYALASGDGDVNLSPQLSPELAKGAQEYWARTKLLFGSLTA